METRRKIGRPPTRLLDNITSTSGLKIHEIVRASEDREKWRTIVTLSSAAANTDYGDVEP